MSKRMIEFKKDGIYHIFSRSQGRVTIFRGYQEYFHFASRMFYLANIMEIELMAWCILPNHFHFLLEQKGDATISRFMQRLLTGFAKRYNYLVDGAGHVFEKRFGAREVATEEYKHELYRYIVGNSVHHELVDDAADWPFSNYGELKSRYNLSGFSDDEDEFEEMERKLAA